MTRKTLANHSDSVNRRTLRAQIELWRDNVIDLDIRVDDARRDVDGAVARFQEAVHERQRSAVHLERLVQWITELEADAGDAARAAQFGMPLEESRHA